MSKFKKDNAYLELLKTFKKYEALVKTKQRKEDDEYLLRTFQPVFNLSNIDNLTEQNIINFTSFKENRHWNGIHRQNKFLLEDFDKLKSSLKVLLDESITIDERIERVRVKTSPEHVHGLGFTVISAILITAYHSKYPVFNTKVTNAMKLCNVYPFKGTGKYVERYSYMIDLCSQIKKDTGLSYFEIDGIWHHILEDKPTIYKHSPGSKGFDFEKQYNDSVVALGWNDSGSLDSFEEDNEYEDAAIKAVESGNGKDKSYIQKQYKFLMDMNDQDFIMYYKEGKIIGVAIVDGEDYEYKSEEHHAHRRRVKFLNNFKEHTIKDGELVRFFSFTNTLNPLENKLYKSLAHELKTTNPQIDWEKLLKIKAKKSKNTVNFKGFKQEAFDILKAFKENPQYTEYQNYEDAFKKELKAPLTALMKGLKEPIKSTFLTDVETDKRILSIIKKNDWGKGGIYSHYWGAFYHPSAKRSSSSQLYVILKDDHLRAGFGFGQDSQTFKDNFIKNLTEFSEFSEEYFELLESNHIKIMIEHADGTVSTTNISEVDIEQLKAIDTKKEYITFKREFTDKEVIEMEDSLFDELNETFKLLIPCYALSSTDSPEKYIDKWKDTFNFLADEDIDSEEAVSSISSWPDFVSSMNWTDDFKEPTNIKHCLGDYENQNSPKKNIIFFEPPGTGKSMCAKNLAKLIASSPKNIYKVQFHQSYSYENFIQGIRPETKDGILSYNFYEGPFVDFCNKAVNNPNQNYVFIIDEVNRGNLSRIFGELLYLLEYPEESLPLMYDQTKKLRIPKNAYIVGTMNSADRSIAMVDYALRRRFRFVEFAPNSKILREFYSVVDEEFETILNFFDILNQKIGSVDKRLSIGHSYFIREDLKEEGLSKSELNIIWDTEIYPLLEEYFANMPNQLADFSFEKIWESASQTFELKSAA